MLHISYIHFFLYNVIHITIAFIVTICTYFSNIRTTETRRLRCRRPLEHHQQLEWRKRLETNRYFFLYNVKHITIAFIITICTYFTNIRTTETRRLRCRRPLEHHQQLKRRQRSKTNPLQPRRRSETNRLERRKRSEANRLRPRRPQKVNSTVRPSPEDAVGHLAFLHHRLDFATADCRKQIQLFDMPRVTLHPAGVAA